ncbi:conserved hypothetical protein [Candidatus Desulfarcum epimagneticum]|uniref:Uncharacterized protein n=1 Tax=uncultured Desulfobacteraceae bacterium TaxID=218296 RepID=A0A484HIH9_9BACT|nr:conserved hypothetical protein [uncultured Desulfobacteraceae bacterium]
MKTGVIVYIAGSDDSELRTDWDAEVEKLEIEADMVETISPTSGHFDIPDAWLAMTVKGMHRIECMVAERAGSGGLRLQDKRLRLCG